MKIEIIGIINSFEVLRPTQNWSNSQTDSRFVGLKHIRSKVKVTAYMNGERFLPEGKQDFYYNIKLNVQKIEAAK